jgi:hypothetical protein
MTMLRYSLDLFAPHVGSDFSVELDGEPMGRLVMDRAVPIASPPGQEQFSVIFVAAGETPAVQGNYHLGHSVLGEFDLLLVPIGRAERGVEFEACFNNIVPVTAS